MTQLQATNDAHRSALGDSHDIVVRRYASVSRLGAADITLLRSLTDTRERVFPGQELECEGSPHRAPALVVSGWACRFRLLPDGRRAITSFVLPGDAIGVSRRHTTALVSTAALSHCRIVSAMPLCRALAAQDSAHVLLLEAQRRLDALEEVYTLSHMVRLGRQTALERICHLLLELRWRLEHVGLAPSDEFPLPLTQESLADAVGLSVVHVNRTLQQMRRKGLVDLRQGRAMLLDPDAMAEAADFKPFHFESTEPSRTASLSLRPH